MAKQNAPKNIGLRSGYLLTGTIRTEKNIPVPGLTIRAYDKKAGKKLRYLGKTQSPTDEQGRYQIDYTRKVTQVMGSKGADLLIKVYGKNNKLIKESRLLMNAPAKARIDVVVPNTVFRGLSVFEKLEKSIFNLIEQDQILGLDEEDLDYLSTKLGKDTSKIKRLIHARELESNVQHHPSGSLIPAAHWYALLEKDVLLPLNDLLSLPESSIKDRLQQASQLNLIPFLSAKQIELQITAFQELSVEVELVGSDDPEAFSVKGLIDILDDLPQSKKDAFVRSYTLKSKASQLDLAKEEKDIQELFKLKPLTDGHLPLIKALHQELKAGRTSGTAAAFTHISDLARNDSGAWSAFLKTSKIKLPRKENGRRWSRTAYAKKLATAFKQSFPAIDIINTLQGHRYLPDDRKPGDEVSRFIVQNPEIDLQKVAIQEVWGKADKTGFSQTEQKKLRKELERVQRVYHLLPEDDERNDRAATLLSLDLEWISLDSKKEAKREKIPLDSAWKVARIPKRDFVTAWEKTRKKTWRTTSENLRLEGEEIYDRARSTALAVSNAFWNHSQMLDTMKPAMVASTAVRSALPAPQKTRSLNRSNTADPAELMANPYYREVQHCESVLGPAAYLEELKNILKATVGENVLINSRPDLLELIPDCKNTETELPYIDLVNELLERFLAFSLGEISISAFNLQTSDSTEDLALLPEHELPEAYLHLAKASSSLSLPWDRWLTEAKLFLQYMEISLKQLVECVEKVSAGKDMIPALDRRKYQLENLQAIRAFLSLSSPAYEYIQKDLSTETWMDLFGISENKKNEAYELSVLMPLLGFWTKNQQGDTGEKEYELVRQILGSTYIQQAVAPSLRPVMLTSHTNPIRGTISYLSKGFLIRLTRFERIRRTLGWTPRELHQAIMIFGKVHVEDGQREFGAGIFTNEMLINLAHVEQLRREKSQISVMELLSWWGPMESGYGYENLPTRYQSEIVAGNQKHLYERVFLNKSFFDQQENKANLASAWAAFQLNIHRDELVERDEEATLSDHLGLISAALRVREREARSLIGFLTGKHRWVTQPILVQGNKTLPDSGNNNTTFQFSDTLTLKNLSVLYKAVSIARFLQISVDDFIHLNSLIGQNLFQIKTRRRYITSKGKDKKRITLTSYHIQTSDTLVFIETARQILQSPWSIRDVAYLWQDYTEGIEELSLIRRRIERFLGSVKEELKAVNEQAAARQAETVKISDSGQIDPIASLLTGMRKLRYKQADIRDVKYLLEGQYALIPKQTGDPEKAKDRAKKRIGEILPHLNSNQKNEVFRLLVSKRPAQLRNHEYSTLFFAIRVPHPSLYLSQRQQTILDFMEAFQFDGARIAAIRSALDSDGSGGRVTDSTLKSWLNENLKKLVKFIREPLNEGVLNQYASFLYRLFDPGRDLFYYDSFAQLKVYFTETLNANAPEVVAFLSEKLGAFLSLPADTTASLLTWVLTDIDGEKSQVNDFVNWAHTGGGEIDEHMFQHVRRLEKIAWLAREWALTGNEIVHIQSHKADFNGFDWNLIPVSDSVVNQRISQKWNSLHGYVTARNRLSVQKGDLIRLFEKARDVHQAITEEKNEQAKEQTMAVRTMLVPMFGLTEEEMGEMLEVLGYVKEGILVRGALREGASLHPLMDLHAHMKKTGRPAGELAFWVESSAGNSLDKGFPAISESLQRYKKTVVRQIRQAVKAQCTDTQWRQVAKNLQDQLRIQKRDRLLDAISKMGLISNFSLEALYGEMLIDPQMDPCMRTTRTKQAISSLQLFIHRLLIGLTTGPDETELEALREKWNWIKNYRVWEAQRKVFLYPENWIEPELRDNKSPFFEDFEGELAQGELNAQNIEKAIKTYLTKLDEVGHLEMVSFYEWEAELHLVGRTREKPHVHYYRYQDADQIWHPWKQIELDIESEVVLLVIHNHTPHIFWPSIKHRIQKLGQDNPDDANNDKTNYRPVMDIRFNWSKYEEGRWTPKKKNDTPAVLMYEWKYQELFENPEAYLFYTIHAEGQEITIGAYMPGNWVNAIYTYTWDNEKLDKILRGVSDVPAKVDWTYIMGKNGPFGTNAVFNEESAGLIERSVKILTDSINDEISKILFHHTSDRNDLDQDVSDVIDKYIAGPSHRTLHHGREYLLWEGALGYWLDEFPFQWSNNADPTDDDTKDKFGHDYEVDGIRLGDKAKINEVLEALGDLSNIITELDISNYHYRCLSISHDSLSENELKRFASITFSGYKLTSHTENALGLNSIQHSDGSKIEKNLNFVRGLGYSPASPPVSLRYNFLVYSSNYITRNTKKPSANTIQFDIGNYFYHDDQSCLWATQITSYLYTIKRFYHPWTEDFNRIVHDKNYVDSHARFAELFLLSLQNEPKTVRSVSSDEKRLSFDYTKPFSLYNWEIFFHIPFTIATRLSQNKQFEEAQRWFHYIFNPFGDFALEDADPGLPPSSRYWNVLPLHQLKGADSLAEIWGNRDEWEAQNKALAKDPFQPHRLARVRKVTYQKAVVSKYLDNLLAWGDHLFERDTLESINEATLLYSLATNILGPRPRKLPGSSPILPEGLDPSAQSDHSQTFEAFESLLSTTHAGEDKSSTGYAFGKGEVLSPVTHAQSPASWRPVPHNNKLLAYWDTVADRLFNIRHCRNIEGVDRELPIFEPPIDPGFLVRGSALGIEISELLSDLYAPLPPYRFRFMMQKAYEFCGDVRSLGGALLSALEKKDGEELSLLRSRHERRMLKLTHEVRKSQIEELRENLKSTRVALEMAESKFEYYNSKQFENQNEKQHVRKLALSNSYNLASQIMSAAAAVSYAIPDYITNLSTGDTDVKAGGKMIGDALKSTGDVLGIIGTVFGNEANMHSIQAGRERRWEDWQFQAQQTRKEIQQLNKQILAAEIRIAIAEKELSNHEQQQAQAEEIETFMRHKFTNQELYQWMVSQLSGIYFQTYRMALDLAKRAQKCFQHEQGREEAHYIGASYWDSLKKGLLAGDNLQLDLRRMEEEYIRQNSRDLELSKHISLRALDPQALHDLRYTGRCEFALQEWLFDLDFPGHYYRRIKSLSISVPAVVGPYSGLNANLRLLNSKTRMQPKIGEEYLKQDLASHPMQVALSSSQSANGLFELNHNDERYLPFELKGVVSSWELEFPGLLEQFDRSTISDVVVHVNYSARSDQDLKEIMQEEIRLAYENGNPDREWVQQLDIRREFSDRWHQYVTKQTSELILPLTKNRFPYVMRPFSIQLEHITCFLELENAAPVPKVENDLGEGLPLDVTQFPDASGRHIFTTSKSDKLGVDGIPLPDQVHVNLTGLTDEEGRSLNEIKEFIVLLHYKAKKRGA